MNETGSCEYIIRHPTMDDAQGAADAIIATEIAESGSADYSLAEVQDIWKIIDITRDAYVAVAPDGQIVASMYVEERPGGIYNLDGYVHPDHTERGIGNEFVRLAEACVQQHIPVLPPDVRVVLRHGMQPNNAAGIRLLEQNGFQFTRRFFRMAIDLEAPPPVPQWPYGIVPRRFVQGQDEHATFEALEEAFADMWRRPRGTFADFKTRLDASNFDPDLWFLAFDGEEIAGMALCSVQPDKGYIDSVAVRRRWRGHGLGLALLQTTFGVYYERGLRHIELSVDSESPTGATRLYERAGMYQLFTVALYEKEIRPGRDASTDAVA